MSVFASLEIGLLYISTLQPIVPGNADFLSGVLFRKMFFLPLLLLFLLFPIGFIANRLTCVFHMFAMGCSYRGLCVST